MVAYSSTFLEHPLSPLHPNISNAEIQGSNLPMREVHHGILLSLVSSVLSVDV